MLEDVHGSSVLGVNYPRRKLSGYNYLGAIFLGGNCTGGNYPGVIVWGTVVRGATVLGGNCRGGGGQLSSSYIKGIVKVIVKAVSKPSLKIND